MLQRRAKSWRSMGKFNCTTQMASPSPAPRTTTNNHTNNAGQKMFFLPRVFLRKSAAKVSFPRSRSLSNLQTNSEASDRLARTCNLLRSEEHTSELQSHSFI